MDCGLSKLIGYDGILNQIEPWNLGGILESKILESKKRRDVTDAHFLFTKGTTAVGFIYQGGITMAVDSLNSTQHEIIPVKDKKTMALAKSALVTSSGVTADCKYWGRKLTLEYENEYFATQKPLSPSDIQLILYKNITNITFNNLTILIGGYEGEKPNLFLVDSQNEIHDEKLITSGSGGMHARSIIQYGYNYNLTNEDAFELARSAVFQALQRGINTGSVVRVFHVQKDDWKQVSHDNVHDLFQKYNGKKKEEGINFQISVANSECEVKKVKSCFSWSEI